MGSLDIGLIFPSGLSVEAGLELLWPVLAVVLGMVGYAVFVFKFYRFVAARDMFGLDLSKNDQMRDAVAWDLIFLVWYLVRYVVLFPAFAFFWFAVLTLILVFLSEDRELHQILLIAMATVSAIRVSAYYNEELSRDLAKILPFAVLGVFIINTSFFNIQSSLDTLAELNTQLDTIVYYLVYLVALEFALRFVFVVFRLIFPSRREPEPAQRPAAAPAPASSEPVGQGEPVGSNATNGREGGLFASAEPEQGAGTRQRPD